MRYLIFSTDDETSEIYASLYGGLVTTIRPFNKAEARIIGRILTMLESNGKPVDDLSFELVKPFTLELEEVEYKLISSALDEVQWTTRGTRRASRMYDWLENLPEAQPS